MNRCEVPDEFRRAKPAPSDCTRSPEGAKSSLPVAGLLPADMLGAVEEAFGSEEGDFLDWLWPLSPLEIMNVAARMACTLSRLRAAARAGATGAQSGLSQAERRLLQSRFVYLREDSPALGYLHALGLLGGFCPMHVKQLPMWGEMWIGYLFLCEQRHLLDEARRKGGGGAGSEVRRQQPPSPGGERGSTN